MQGIKATIHGSGSQSSVEFSLEEAISQHRGKPWSELSEAEQDAALRDYALSLFQRQTGASDAQRVDLSGGTFSPVSDKDV